jgi:hypothetical protein
MTNNNNNKDNNINNLKDASSAGYSSMPKIRDWPV